MQLSYTTLSVPDKTLHQAVEVAKKYALEGIELRGKGYVHLSPECDTAYRAEAKKMIWGAGLKIPCITAYTCFAQPSLSMVQEQLEILKRYIELCEEMGATSIRTFMGVYPQENAIEETEKIIVEGLQRAAELLTQSEVRLLIETHDSMESGRQLEPILRQVDERVGVLLDVVHPYRMGESVQETIQRIGRRIHHVHIKDVYQILPDGCCYSPIGAGLLPVRETVSALESTGYQGFYSLEWEKSVANTKGVSFREQMESFVAYMRRMEK